MFALSKLPQDPRGRERSQDIGSEQRGKVNAWWCGRGSSKSGDQVEINWCAFSASRHARGRGAVKCKRWSWRSWGR